MIEKSKSKIPEVFMLRICISLLFLSVLITGCTTINAVFSGASPPTPNAIPATGDLAGDCPVTEPAWDKPPEDAAVQDPPAYGYYYVNEDRSIWASVWWKGQEEERLQLSKEGVKVGWFRPEGAALEITGRRIDGQALPLEAHIPCCYPTRFQASGLYFPAAGCWEISAKAADRVLSFVVLVEP
jgi:hypothetical protein